MSSGRQTAEIASASSCRSSPVSAWACASSDSTRSQVATVSSGDQIASIGSSW